MKNWRSGFIGTLLLILVALVIGGGVYFYATGSKSSAPSNTSTDVHVNEAVTTVAPDALTRLLPNKTFFRTMVEDPVNSADWIVTAMEEDANYTNTTNHIYSYDSKADTLSPILTFTDPNYHTRIAHILGTQGARVIFFMDVEGRGGCATTWSSSADKFLYLDMSNLKAGMQSYTVPQYLVDKDRADFDACSSEPGGPG